MARKSETKELTSAILEQPVALAVAAHLTRTQLVPDPLKVYDAQHLSEMLNVVALALARTAPLYVSDPAGGPPRQLAPLELEGATVRRSGAQLVLKDGRALAGVTVRRGDLRQAIAILRAVGLQQIAPQLARRIGGEPPAPERSREEELLQRLAEIEALLAQPLSPAQIEQANSRIVSLARSSPHGRVSNQAMRLMSTLHEARERGEPAHAEVAAMLAQLRAAVREAHSA